MTKNKQKEREEWQKENDRRSLYILEGNVHVLMGFAHAVIAQHSDPASVRQSFVEWSDAAYKRVQAIEADHQGRLPVGHPDKIMSDEDWPHSDYDWFEIGMDEVFTELRNALDKKAQALKEFREKLWVKPRNRSRLRKK